MKVFFDTNVIIDAITSRDYNYRDSQKLVVKAAKKEIDGYISSKQITEIYYILRKYINDEKTNRIVLKQILDTFEILPFLQSDAAFCVNSKIDDYEDAVIAEAAKVNCIPYLITNDIKHFKNADINVLTPHDLIVLLDAKSSA